MMGLTLLSQVFSAASTLVLPILGLAVADTYAIASQIGLSGFTGIVVGIVYNLAVGRPHFHGWKAWSAVASATPIAFAGLQIAILNATGYFEEHDVFLAIEVISVLALGGALLSPAAVIGVRRAFLGRPILFASATLIPNIGLCAGAILGSITGMILLPAAGWFVFAAALMLISIQLPSVEGPSFEAPEARDATRVHALGLLLNVLASTALPVLYVSAIAQLPTGSAYLVVLISKIANSAVSLIVNSVLLVRYNWVEQRSSSTRLVTWTTGAFVLLGGASLLLGPSVGFVSIGIMVMGWLALLVASAVSIREINAGRLGRLVLLKSVVEVAIAGSMALLLLQNPSVTGYFGAFAVSQAITVIANGVGFRRPLVLGVAVAALFIAVLHVILGA
ncbi:hypothetical protein ACWEOH_02640 [Agromyces sp. NPDC004153]